MGMLKEFKEFAVKGNVIDLAVAVVIGAAFGKIIDSMVNDIIMPIVGKVLGDANFFVSWEAGGIPIGKFVQAVFNFLVIAFVIFLVIKGINSAKKKQQAAPPAPPEPSSTDKLLMEIRDALKK